MTGGFLGQRQRGRAQGVRRVRCGRAASALWTGVLLMAGVAGAQGVPAAPTPARTPPVVQSGADAATPAQAQQSPAAQTADSGLTTTVWEWKGLRVDKILFEGVTFD